MGEIQTYRILRKLGAGSMGTVFLAAESGSAHSVALKCLSAQGHDDFFRSEVRLLARLSHPYLVKIYDYYETAADRVSGWSEAEAAFVSRPCFTMEYVAGAPLHALERAPDPEGWVRLLFQVCEALAYLHARNLLHRDLKPANILVDADAHPKILDFGLASPPDSKGSVRGTLPYMAPEAFWGELGAASDLFSVGVLFYQCLVGRLPFTKPVHRGKPPEPKPLRELRPDLPEFFCDCLHQLLELSPSRRPSSAHAVLRYLAQHQTGLVLSEREKISRLGKTPWSGRDDEFQKIVRAVDFSAPLRIGLSGPTGVGRSRFLEELKWHFQLNGVPCFLVPPPEAGENLPDGLPGAGRDAACLLLCCDLHRWPEEAQKTLALLLRSAARSEPRLVPVLEWNSDLPAPRVLTLCEDGVRRLDVTLGDLSPAASEGLLRNAAWEDELAPEELKKILEAAGGRPLFLLEALRQRFAPEAELSIDTDLREISRRRVEQLSAGARRLLALVVTHSRPVSPADAESLGAEGAREDALLELDERGFLAMRSAERPELRLSQSSLQEPLQAAFTAAERLEAHRCWIELLRSRVSVGVASPEAVLLAEHAWAAEDKVRFKAVALAAAEAEIARGAEAAAISWYERLLSCAETPVERYTCNGLRAPLLYRQGRFAEALAAYEAWYQDRDDDATQLQKVKHRFFTGLVQFAAGRPAEAEARFAAAIATGDSRRDEPLRYYHARSLAFLASLEQGRKNFVQAEACLQRGLELAGSEPLLVGELEQRLGELHQAGLRYSEAFANFERSRAAYQAAGQPQAEAGAWYALALAHRECGDPRAALAAMEKATDLSRGNGQVLQTARCLEQCAALRMDAAEYSRAQRDFAESGEALAVLGTEEDRLAARIHRAEWSLALGNLDQAEKFFRELAAETEALRARGLAGEIFFCRAEGLYRLGDYVRAGELFSEALRCLDAKPARFPPILAALGLCRCRARLGSLSRDSETVQAALTRLAALPESSYRVWERALRILISDRSNHEWPRQFQTLLDSVAALPSPEGRLDLYGILSLEAERMALGRTALRLKELRRREWENIYQALTEELQMDFEKNRDPDDLDLLLSESLPRVGKQTPERRSEAPRAAESTAGPSEARFRQYIEINRQLARRHELGEILERLIDAAIELTGAERGFLLLRKAKAAGKSLADFEVKAARNLKQDSLHGEEFKLSLSAVDQALQQGVPRLTRDAQADSFLHLQKSVVLYQIQSLLVVPLEVDGKPVGVLYLDHRSRADCFREEDVVLLTAFASQAALALEKARMMQELRAAKEQLEVKVECQAGEIIELSQQLTRAREELRYSYDEIVGRSPPMMRVFELLDHVTETTIPVWVHGESGTGKELIARSLHFNSERKGGPFVAENVSAIPETLLESELFGFKKGAFTHADRDRVGLFEQASGGTLFLDEVADMSLAMQAKLLRVLQEGEVRPLGSNQKVKVDVRLVTASNKDLEKLVREEKFRQDLFFRINGLTIRLPPLRERKEDIPLVAEHLLHKVARQFKLPAAALTAAATDRLLAYSWPGNIRELEGVLRNALLFAKGRDIGPDLISFGTSGKAAAEPDLPERGAVPAEERRLILEALRHSKMNKRLAAEEMGISLRSLYKRMERHGIPTQKAILAKFLGMKG